MLGENGCSGADHRNGKRPSPEGDGWFVLNAREAEWWTRSGLGTVCDFERGAYTVNETARRHGAGVQRETTEGSEAYARFPPWKQMRYRDGSLPD